MNAAADRHSAPPVPKPASQTPSTDSVARRWTTAASTSVSQPPREKSPSDSPQPRKVNVRASHPMLDATRSASSGKSGAASAAPTTAEGNP